MKASSMCAVLSTLLPVAQLSLPLVAAEPIPAAFRGHSLRSLELEQSAEAVEHIAKRALTDDLYGDNGSGPRYWAWSKLAYDDEYNDQPGKTLGDGTGKAWEKLNGGEIFVKGVTGGPCQGSFPWGVSTGMKATVGLDSSNQVIVLAFIGSNDFETFKQDLKYPMVSGDAGQVEKGFKQCFDSVSRQVFEWTKDYADTNPGWDIVIAGHSLGGATAHIAAVAFVKDNPDLKDRVNVFTYGAPRAGDLDFQIQLGSNQGTRMANFQHEWDMITDVPLIKQGYANSANRHIFKPSTSGVSWSDQSQWTFIASADETTAGFRSGIVDAAKSLKSKFSTHTGYFGSGNTVTRRAERLEELQAENTMQRRDVIDEAIVNSVDSIIDYMIQSGELRDEVQVTSNLDKFVSELGITAEQGALIIALNEETTEDGRIELLKLVLIAAAEQE